MTTGRGTGATTKQLQGAGRGAVFVWCNDHLWYPKELAAHLGRSDVRIVGPGWVVREGWRGLSCDVVVDHAFWQIASRRERQAAEYMGLAQASRNTATAEA